MSARLLDGVFVRYRAGWRRSHSGRISRANLRGTLGIVIGTLTLACYTRTRQATPTFSVIRTPSRGRSRSQQCSEGLIKGGGLSGIQRLGARLPPSKSDLYRLADSLGETFGSSSGTREF